MEKERPDALEMAEKTYEKREEKESWPEIIDLVLIYLDYSKDLNSINYSVWCGK